MKRHGIFYLLTAFDYSSIFFVVDTKEASRCFCLYWEGVIPSALVKTRLKYIWSGKPVCSATCLMDIVESSMDFAFSILKFVR